MFSIRSIVVGLCFLCASEIAYAEDAKVEFEKRVQPILKAHCVGCHGGEKPKAKVSLAGARTLEQIASERDLWFRVLAQVENGAMPPEGETALTADERKSIVGWVRGEFTEMLDAKQLKEGRSKFRRLSRNEYANTIEDLFGVRPRVDLHLPDDGRVDGYDKLSAALPLSAEGSLGYFTMADELLKKWVLKPIPKGYDPGKAGRTVRAEAMESGQSPGHTLRLDDGTMVSFNSDTTSGRLNYKGVRVPGIHRIRVSVYGYQTDKPLPFGIFVGNTGSYPQVLELAKVLEAPPGKAAVLETEIYLKSPSGIRLIPFNIGVQVPKNTLAKNCKGPGLAVQWIEDEEPELPLAGDRWLTADFPKAMELELRTPRKVFLSKNTPKNNLAKSVTQDQFLAVMKTTFVRVGAQLFRRDLTTPEIERIVADIAKQIDAGAALDSVFLDKVAELMTAPEFLCVIEDPGPLSDFPLASRLSYFLWNSTPDEALMALARAGKLRDPKVLKEQTERLLNDPKAGRFVSDFADQWLGLRGIDDTTPDDKLYPEYTKDELLKPSSVRETQAFFRAMLEGNLGVKHFVDSPWAFVNAPLAKHYGIPGISGVELRKVDLPESSPYRGLWTQSAVMKVTANGTGTSPVKRGVWVAERLLGTPIPPPPPNVNPIEPDIRGAKTLREQLALHSSGGTCAACHAKFDPYGFALESFDVTGAFRKNYRVPDPDAAALPPQQRKGRALWREGLPVDSSGKTPGGEVFAGIAELRKMLAADPEALAKGLVRHLMIYSTGAPVSVVDQPAVARIAKAAATEGHGVRSLVHAVVQSETFRSK